MQWEFEKINILSKNIQMRLKMNTHFLVSTINIVSTLWGSFTTFNIGTSMKKKYLAFFWQELIVVVQSWRLKPHNITDLFHAALSKKIYINSNLLALGTMSSSSLKRKATATPQLFYLFFLQYESKNEMKWWRAEKQDQENILQY